MKNVIKKCKGNNNLPAFSHCTLADLDSSKHMRSAGVATVFKQNVAKPKASGYLNCQVV